MIVYLDTSALVRLLIEEPASSACGELWDAADRVVCTRSGYIEATAAVAMAERMDRLSAKEHQNAHAVLDELWRAIDVIELDHGLMSNAARLSAEYRLRGYGAVHCGAALEATTWIWSPRPATSACLKPGERRASRWRDTTSP